MTEAKTGAMWPKVKEYLDPQTPEEARNELSSRVLEQSTALPPFWASTFQTVREYISVLFFFFCYSVYDNLLWQSPEMNIDLYIYIIYLSTLSRQISRYISLWIDRY